MMENIFNRNFFRETRFQGLYAGNVFVGAALDICFPDSRGTHLSCLENFTLRLDGRGIDWEKLRFCLHGKDFCIWELPCLAEEYWTLLEWATIKIYEEIKPGNHSVEISYRYRVPFTGNNESCVRESVFGRGDFLLDASLAPGRCGNLETSAEPGCTQPLAAYTVSERAEKLETLTARDQVQAQDIRLGVSLFSMGKDYALGQMSMEEAIKLAGKIGYTGFELVSAQMVPGYPYPSREWCQRAAQLFKSSGLEPVAYGSYVDTARFSGRDLTEKEIYAAVYNDMLIAKTLGFKILKVNDEIGCQVLKSLIPAAKAMDLWIGVEFHQPNTIDNEKWSAYFNLFEALGSAHIGVVVDTGIFDKREHPVSMADFRKMLKYCRYIHGKFICLENDREDKNIDFAQIVRTAREEGFCGYINAEYEGYFHDLSLDTRQQLTWYYRIMRRLLS